MRVVFMGSPEFAVPTLQALVSAHEVIAVYTAPDRVRARGKTPTPTPVKEAALQAELAVYQPPSLRDPVTQDTLRSLAPDAICVAAYGLLLPPEVLAIPPKGCINVHASLLPRYRGAAPVHWAILNGDEVTGVTIMRMEQGLDTGPTASIRETPIGELSLAELTATLALLGAEALIETLSLVEEGVVNWISQLESQATYAAKVTDADLRLAPELSCVDAARRVRASSVSARAKLVVCDRTVDVLSAHPADTDLDVGPGELRIVGRSLIAGFWDGALVLEQVKAAGRSATEGWAFACGLRLADQARWEPVP